jgi:hypothetical protein
MKQETMNNKISKPPYLLGLLGLIPLVGFFIGVGLLLYGIIKYKDKKLIIIGIVCMLFTVLVYSSLFYIGFKSDFGKKAWVTHSQIQLNSLLKNVEFYKLENGYYPDSLVELQKKDKFAMILDPLQLASGNHNMYFNYRNLDSTYLLFSSGVDGIPNTKDDLFPVVSPNKNIGWRQTQ